VLYFLWKVVWPPCILCALTPRVYILTVTDA
jgi:hypothetical protein